MGLSKIQKYFIIGLLYIGMFFIIGFLLKKAENKTLDNLQVVLRAKVIKDDVFQFFYWDKSETKFKINKSIKVEVKGINRYQDITFKLPQIIDIHKFRLDIGENLNQKTISVKEIKFIKKEGEINLDIDGFNRLFKPNKYINTGTKKGTFIGKSKSVYDPYFVSIDKSKEFISIKSSPLTSYPFLIAAFISIIICLFIAYNLDKVLISQKGLFIVAFMIILALPTIQNKLHFTKQLKNIEKRELAEKPSFAFSKEFARSYESYYDDNFGLRNNLINWGGTFRTKAFRSSMHPELVMFGKDKWLYYNRMKGRVYRSYSHTNLLTKDKLKRLVQQWEINQKKYEADGRKYFLAYWPNKHTIYPEHLPFTMDVQIKDTISRIDQILQYMDENNSSIKMLDVRSHLIESKKENLLYHKFDSHWNNYGAFLAYQRFFIENKDRLGISPKNLADFDVSWKDHNQGELIQMLGVHNKGFFIEKNPTFVLRENKNQIEFLPTKGYPRLTKITRNNHSGNKLRALIFRDSYTNHLIQFFSLHFYEVYYIWGKNKETFVNKLQPDIVIDGFVEREIGEKIQ